MNVHTLTFDKLAYLDRLKSAGVSEEVAHAHADGLDQALRESIATKADLEALGRDLADRFEAADRKLDQKIDGLEKGLDAKIAKIDSLDRKIDEVEKRLGARIDGVEKKLDSLDARLAASVSELKAQNAEGHTALMRWMIGTVFAAIGLLWAMLHYVH